MIAARHVLFGLAALGLLMGSIDSTIVAVAVPALGTALQASLTSVGWTLTAYLVVQIIMLPVAGKLSDSFGRKRVFLFCLSTFSLGSLLCGIAPSIGWLIAFRGVQALGGGGLVPSAIGIVADLYPRNRAQAVGLFTSIGPIGAILGPNLGGYILEHLTWRELFFINAPVGLCVLAGVTLLLTDKQQAKRQVFRLDIVGLGLYAAAILLLMGGMSLAGADPSVWRNPWLWGMFGMSLLLGLLFAHHIRSADNPVVDPAILLRRPFVAANLYSFAFGAASFGFFTFIPLYAVSRFGMTTMESGAVLTPRAIAMILTSLLASLLIARTGYRKPMLVGMGLVITTLLILSRGMTTLQVGGVTLSGFWLMALIIALSGIGIGLASPASNNAALDLASTKVAAVTGIRSMFNMTGEALSVTAIVLALSYAPDAAAGLELTFVVLAAVMCIGMLLAMCIPDRRSRHAVRSEERAPRPIRIVYARPVAPLARAA